VSWSQTEYRLFRPLRTDLGTYRVLLHTVGSNGILTNPLDEGLLTLLFSTYDYGHQDCLRIWAVSHGSRQQVLLRENQPIPVTPKAFETLLALVRHSHDVVSKEQLLKEVWPDSFVEESNLSQNIFMLPKALGDIAENRQYTVTLPGRGYRFAASVRTVTQQGEVVVAHARARTQIVIEENEPETEQALKMVPKDSVPPKMQPRRPFYYSLRL
jgi:DNA-binding winged helix-turn-helix (wHTH) protein